MNTRARPTWLHITMLVGAIALAAIGFAAAWVTLGLVSGDAAQWMMTLAALDTAAILTLLAEPPGRRRALLAALGTALAIGLGLWLLNAVQFGRLLGLGPLTAIDRLGPHLAWQLIRASTGTGDVVLATACVIMAGLWGRHSPLNARRRSP